MLLKDLVDRLDVSYREARYALERGHADVWFEQSPGSGNHRELTKAAVYALGLLLLLKKSGFSTPMAQGIVMCIQPYMKGVKIVTRSLNEALLKPDTEIRERMLRRAGIYSRSSGRAIHRLATNNLKWEWSRCTHRDVCARFYSVVPMGPNRRCRICRIRWTIVSTSLVSPVSENGHQYERYEKNDEPL